MSDRCRKARACTCNVCGPLKSINPNIFDACLDSCQDAPRPLSHTAYLCETVSPEVLFNRYGLVLCGFDPHQTLEGELYAEYQENEAEKSGAQFKLIYALGAVVLLLLGVFILR